MARPKPSHSTSVLGAALREAETGVIEQPPAPGTRVQVAPALIRLRPELFQPRVFSHGLREVDPDHRNTLRKRIELYGELDPPLIIKINGEWVCIDGHHRLAAYGAAGRHEPITCEWFGGSVREALDESVARNNKDKLTIPLEDRLEGAWKRVLLDMGSKQEVARLFGVGTTTIADMRGVRRIYDEDAGFRQKVGDIFDTSWSKAKALRIGLDPKEASAEERAQRLARNIRRRMSKLLSADAATTARALAILDPRLPDQLIGAWLAPEPAAVPDLVGSNPNDAMRLALIERQRAQGQQSLNELETRRRLVERERDRLDAAIAALTDPTAPTQSDLTWERWVLTDRINRDLESEPD